MNLLVLQIWFMINIIFCYCTAMACSFDSISLNIGDVPVTSVNYVGKVTKREIHYNNYRPLRIHLHFGPSESDTATFQAVKNVLKLTVSTVSRLIEVIPVSGPLLLDRLGCVKRWNHGVNKGLCSELLQNYKGEFCENKIDLFQIPLQHLTGLELYNFTSSSPVYSLPSGQGVVNADFIMYVISHLSDFCLHQDVQAYASYCRLDQNGRPVAGFINYCPNRMQGKPLNKKRMFYIALHEIFHTLGFSKDLFHKYRSCKSESGNCTSIKHMITTDSHGLYRLNLPSVVQQMKKHFNCTDDEFGAPLEMKETADSYSSHWDPLIMFGSIMTPTLAEPKFISVDPITLSAFADSGWYKVNFSNADEYYWGKGKGCNFGFEENCDTGSYPQLCNLKRENYSAGCDFLQQSVSHCQAVKQNSSCGLFKPNLEDQCRLRKPDIAAGAGARSTDMRCFISKEIKKVQPICTVFRCAFSKLDIWFNGTWRNCPNDSEIILNEITILCPEYSFLCHPLYKRHPYLPEEDHSFSSPDHDSPEHSISLKLKFDEPTPKRLLEVSTMEHFKVAAIEAIAEQLSMPLEWIIHSLLTSIENLVLIIYIDPPEKTMANEILKLVENVQNFVN